MTEQCISCKTTVANETGSVRFLCPKCGKYEIVRCKNCRQIVAKYTCPKCEFTGPN
ncbi:MAG: DUF1610 domain-containing protein [Nanoarchaeota archaeon]|nr:DUF1610 domain-containing protein [DPANN group archaeon]MBL7116776.1 DUF1610 domain-containing protein [Nanoarchaeota archaeon]